jgi:hypothetical protein
MQFSAALLLLALAKLGSAAAIEQRTVATDVIGFTDDFW